MKMFADAGIGISCPSGNKVYIHPISGDLQLCTQQLGVYNETSCPGGTACERFPILIPGFQDYCCWSESHPDADSQPIKMGKRKPPVIVDQVEEKVFPIPDEGDEEDEDDEISTKNVVGKPGRKPEDESEPEEEEEIEWEFESTTRRPKKSRGRKGPLVTTTTEMPEITTTQRVPTSRLPQCNNPSDTVLIDYGNRLRDCYFQQCLNGFKCEFNREIRRFICCGRGVDVPPAGLPMIPAPKPLIPRPFRPSGRGGFGGMLNDGEEIGNANFEKVRLPQSCNGDDCGSTYQPETSFRVEKSEKSDRKTFGSLKKSGSSCSGNGCGQNFNMGNSNNNFGENSKGCSGSGCGQNINSNFGGNSGNANNNFGSSNNNFGSSGSSNDNFGSSNNNFGSSGSSNFEANSNDNNNFGGSDNSNNNFGSFQNSNFNSDLGCSGPGCSQSSNNFGSSGASQGCSGSGCGKQNFNFGNSQNSNSDLGSFAASNSNFGTSQGCSGSGCSGPASKKHRYEDEDDEDGDDEEDQGCSNCGGGCNQNCGGRCSGNGCSNNNNRNGCSSNSGSGNNGGNINIPLPPIPEPKPLCKKFRKTGGGNGNGRPRNQGRRGNFRPNDDGNNQNQNRGGNGNGQNQNQNQKKKNISFGKRKREFKRSRKISKIISKTFQKVTTTIPTTRAIPTIISIPTGIPTTQIPTEIPIQKSTQDQLPKNSSSISVSSPLIHLKIPKNFPAEDDFICSDGDEYFDGVMTPKCVPPAIDSCPMSHKRCLPSKRLGHSVCCKSKALPIQ
ncbi:unnamed protein product [Caenorhabditis angaria]|uniref:Uncharacterized protein n=1 Tax=Caenorhabditis angaria TaxID=860376 RepID=A0A9P1IYQ4_9PELO|nr:unnamed protein product [Caenorhabditis angaria]